MNAKMRDLHTMVTDLENADEAALDQYAEAVRSSGASADRARHRHGSRRSDNLFRDGVDAHAEHARAICARFAVELETVADNPAAKEASIARAIAENRSGAHTAGISET